MLSDEPRFRPIRYYASSADAFYLFLGLLLRLIIEPNSVAAGGEDKRQQSSIGYEVHVRYAVAAYTAVMTQLGSSSPSSKLLGERRPTTREIWRGVFPSTSQQRAGHRASLART